MPIDVFEIQLDNAHRSYFAGQRITGTVLIVLSQKPKIIHGIKLKLQGKAKTHWKETSGRSTSHFSEEEVYLDEKVYLIGYESESSETTLTEGSHRYKFSFQLPPNLPSSYCHKYGEVKYHLEATVTRNRKSNSVSKLPFTVNGILDLNQEDSCRAEGHVTKEKTVCCFCCASGPLGFQLRVPKTGFVPGESVAFQASLFNHSTRPISATSISIIQETKFVANLEKSKTKQVQIAECIGPTLEVGESREWIVSSDVSELRLPSVPPSRLDGCKIIFLSYFIKFKMEAKNSATLKGCLPILIGTIPLQEEFPHISAEPSLLPPTETNLDDSSCSSLPQYPDLAPPTYEEAMNGLKAEDAESLCSDPPDYGSLDWKTFIPKYALYKFKLK